MRLYHREALHPCSVLHPKLHIHWFIVTRTTIHIQCNLAGAINKRVGWWRWTKRQTDALFGLFFDWYLPMYLLHCCYMYIATTQPKEIVWYEKLVKRDLSFLSSVRHSMRALGEIVDVSFGHSLNASFCCLNHGVMAHHGEPIVGFPDMRFKERETLSLWSISSPLAAAPPIAYPMSNVYANNKWNCMNHELLY